MALNWTTPSPEQLADYWECFEAFAPAMAAQSRAWWESLTPAQIRGQIRASWLCNEGERHALAKAYLERAEGPAAPWSR